MLHNDADETNLCFCNVHPLNCNIGVNHLKYFVCIKILIVLYTLFIHIAYKEVFQHPERNTWIKHIKDLLYFHGFEYIWNEQAVDNKEELICLFEP